MQEAVKAVCLGSLQAFEDEESTVRWHRGHRPRNQDCSHRLESGTHLNVAQHRFSELLDTSTKIVPAQVTIALSILR